MLTWSHQLFAFCLCSVWVGLHFSRSVFSRGKRLYTASFDDLLYVVFFQEPGKPETTVLYIPFLFFPGIMPRAKARREWPRRRRRAHHHHARYFFVYNAKKMRVSSTVTEICLFSRTHVSNFEMKCNLGTVSCWGSYKTVVHLNYKKMTVFGWVCVCPAWPLAHDEGLSSFVFGLILSKPEYTMLRWSRVRPELRPVKKGRATVVSTLSAFFFTLCNSRRLGAWPTRMGIGSGLIVMSSR